MYSGKTSDGKIRTFGTSGLLYRSNKLMFDHETHSLFLNLTGEPVVGALAQKVSPLKILPMTLTRWGEWRDVHPETTVVKLDAEYGQRWRFRYEPGAADRARAAVSFPVWQKSKALPARQEVYCVRVANASKAYPLDALAGLDILNDRIGNTDVVLLINPESGSVRAFERNNLTFTRQPPSRLLRDGAGDLWEVTEEALVCKSDTSRRLKRLPGHVSLWFAWFGFFPKTEIYSAQK